MKSRVWLLTLFAGCSTSALGWLWANLAANRHLACDEYYTQSAGGGGAEAAAMKCITDALFAQHFGWLIIAVGAIVAVASLLLRVSARG